MLDLMFNILMEELNVKIIYYVIQFYLICGLIVKSLICVLTVISYLVHGKQKKRKSGITST